MFLTKIELDLTNPGFRAALRDSQKLHRLVTGLFRAGRKEADILYRCRVQGILAEVYMYSAIPAEPERLLPGMRLLAQRDVTPWLDSLGQGMTMGFQLLTVPYKKVAFDGVNNSRRRAIRTPEERLTWLQRKGEQGGFQILSVEESPSEKVTAFHSPGYGGRLTMDAYCYTGRLRITDEGAFRRTVRQGIGPGKAYGLGMLLLGG